MDDNGEKEADDISAFKDFLIKLEGGIIDFIQRLNINKFQIY